MGRHVEPHAQVDLVPHICSKLRDGSREVSQVWPFAAVLGVWRL